jgi:arylsulfatase A-like enzyme
MRRFSLVFALLILIAVITPAMSDMIDAAEADRPNVILIMTDDQGSGDLGITDNPFVKTPNIDALAEAGVEVETFYVSPVCAPTRAALMTGRYTYRTGVTDTWLGRAMMYTDETTVAESLGEAGYATGIFGKWHLGDSYPMRPQDQGFDEVLVHTGGGLCQPAGPPDNTYFDPSLMHNGERIQTEGYCSDVYVDYLIDFVEENQDGPFFAYLPFNCPHAPYQISDEYKTPYDEMGMEPSDFPQIGQVRKNVPGNTSAVYGMVENIDDNVGRVLDTLETLGLTENTIVVFLTDNGPNGDRYNCGLRQSKGSVYEGGIRTVFYVKWPEHLEAGLKVQEFGAHIDVFPTLLEACGVDSPEDVAIDGRSLLPLLEGRDVDWTERMYFAQWHRGDYPVPFRKFAARDNRYKLVYAVETPENADWTSLPLELYDLQNDPYEMDDIAAENPEIVRRLAESYTAWLEDVGQDHGYAGPRIEIGTPHEEETILTRQDWRGTNASWSPQGVGHWDLSLAESGRFSIRVEAAAPGQAAAAKIRIQGETLELRLEEDDREYLFPNVALNADADLRLETWIERADGSAYGVNFVYVERVE